MTKDLVDNVLAKVKKVRANKIDRFLDTYRVDLGKNLRVEAEDCNSMPGDMPDVISIEVTDKDGTYEFDGLHDERVKNIYYILSKKYYKK